MVGCSLGNGHKAFEYFVKDSDENGMQMPNAEYLRAACKELILNEELLA